MEIEKIDEETVMFNNVKYRLYPQDPAIKRKFFKSTNSTSPLHRDVWEYHHGTLSNCKKIYHIDGDTTNNELSNLRPYNSFRKPKKVSF